MMIALILTTILSISLDAGAREIIVSPDDFYAKTRFVRHGDVVLCQDGVYDPGGNGKFWPASKSDSDGWITIKPLGSASVTFTGKAYYSAGLNLCSGPKTRFLIEGLTFDKVIGHAIYGKGTSEVLIRDCTFGQLVSGNSVYLINSDSIRIEGCHFIGPVGSYDAGGSGEFIFLNTCTDVEISQNRFGDSGHYCVSIQGSKDCRVTGNEFYQSWGGCVALNLSTENTVVSDNTFHPEVGRMVSYTKAAVAINSSSNVIEGNRFLGTAGSQFAMTLGAYTFAGKRQDCIGNVITENIFTGSGGPAIYVYQKDIATCADNRIECNLFAKNAVNGNPYFERASLVFDDYHSLQGSKWDRKTIGGNTFRWNVIDAGFSVMFNGIFSLPMREAERAVPDVVMDNGDYEALGRLERQRRLIQTIEDIDG